MNERKPTAARDAAAGDTAEAGTAPDFMHRRRPVTVRCRSHCFPSRRAALPGFAALFVSGGVIERLRVDHAL
jgi:hypothetical protein